MKKKNSNKGEVNKYLKLQAKSAAKYVSFGQLHFLLTHRVKTPPNKKCNFPAATFQKTQKKNTLQLKKLMNDKGFLTCLLSSGDL